jgi:hypothetical protein
MKLFAQITGVILLLVALSICWFIITSDYSDAVTSGTYNSQQDERSTLVLGPDHTFTQEVRVPGRVRHAVGAWRRLGEGGVAFSKEFLALPGQEPATDGTSYADIRDESRGCPALATSMQ